MSDNDLSQNSYGLLAAQVKPVSIWQQSGSSGPTCWFKLATNRNILLPNRNILFLNRNISFPTKHISLPHRNSSFPKKNHHGLLCLVCSPCFACVALFGFPSIRIALLALFCLVLRAVHCLPCFDLLGFALLFCFALLCLLHLL